MPSTRAAITEPTTLPDDFAALRAIAEGTAHSTGDEFFRTLVRHLAAVMGTSHAFVAEFLPPNKAHTLAYWSNDKVIDNIEYDLPGTPCERVVAEGLCHFPSGVQREFPREKGIESYLGVPLKSPDGTILGHLCVLDEAPLPEHPQKLLVFQIFAARAAAELERLRFEEKLLLNEERLKDLFDEAPIAYVHEDMKSRFIRANRTALRTLGVAPEEAIGFVGMSLIPDTPEAQRRVRAAFESIGKGTDTGGVELELRRKDNGKPLYIQWWSRPDPSGNFTRTMFIDITERVLLEQEQARLQAQNLYLQEEIKSVHNFDEIVGHSQGLVGVLDNVRRVAPTDATVLILGETGTGKELIARAVHSTSPRADKPFIKINLAALPASLVESELFGHERGAFSGALQKRLGRFELAHGGTIFLDEVGEVPHEMQVKLLRVLQEREFERIGGSQTIKCDVRVVAATNRDLPKAIRDGAFRADLFYRLNVFPINLPPLRDRAEDIPLLAQFFVRKYAPRVGRRIEGIDATTLSRLTQYSWPGNIRELENLIERGLILCDKPLLHIAAEVLPKTANAAPVIAAGVVAPSSAWSDELVADDDEPAANSLNLVQREHILSTLRKVNWVIEGDRGAARQLGIKPATLRHRMKKLGISRTNRLSS